MTLSLLTILEMPSAALPDRRAITFGDSTLTYAELSALAGSWRDALGRSGARGVASIGENRPGAVALMLGAAAAGLDVSLLNYRFKAQELAHCLRLVEPDLVFTWQLRSDAVAQATANTQGRLEVIDVTAVVPPEMPEVSAAAVTAETPALHIFTSGTTSLPKAVVLPHELLLNYLFGSYDALSAAEEEATLISVPLHHIAGVMNTLSALYAGRRIVLLPHFDAVTWLRTAEAERITHAFLVPTMLSQVVDAVRAEPSLRPASLRNLSYGGAPSTPHQIRAAIETFPNVDLVGAFGLTETSSTVAILTPEDHRAILTGTPSQRARVNSVGKPIPSVEIRLAPVGDTWDPGDEESDIGEGEVLVRGPQVSGRYLGAANRIDEHGFFHTGDVGYLDEEGYLFLVGRVDDMIQRGGENVSPAEVELAFLEYPGVSEVAAVAVPHETWGQVVGLVLVPGGNEPLDENKLRDWAQERLASFKRPDFYLQVEALPRNVMGKLLRKQLRDLFPGVGDGTSIHASSH